MPTPEAIADAIQAHGAKKVHDAAVARMNGAHAPLAACGLTAANIGEANTIMTAAFAAMGSADRAADLADASIKAAQIRRPAN